MDTKTYSGKTIRNILAERDDQIFRTVCEKLCKYSDEKQGEEARWEEHCKNCPLWELL